VIDNPPSQRARSGPALTYGGKEERTFNRKELESESLKGDEKNRTWMRRATVRTAVREGG